MDDGATYVSLLQHVARYFDACDRRDLDEIMRILDGATVVAGGTSVSDPDRIRDLYATRQPAPDADGRRATKHHATNLVVTGPADDGSLLAATYYVRLEPGRDGPAIAVSGRLEQVVVRDGDRWRVRTHTILSDL